MAATAPRTTRRRAASAGDAMKRPVLRWTAISAALAGVYGSAFAQQEEITDLTTPQSEVSVGLGYWSKDRPRLGTYDGMNQKGPYGLLDAFINSREDRTGTWFNLEARNLGIDTAEMRAEWLRQGTFGIFAAYTRTPPDEPYTVFTAVQGIGTTTQRVPTPSATELGGIHLGTLRESLGAGFTKVLGGGYDFRVNFKSEDKTGDRLWGRGGAPEFAAEPINSNTRQLEAILSYTSKQFQLNGGYYGSWYTNRNAMVDTALTSGASPFFLSLPLDNQQHQVFVNGGYNLSESTRATFKVSYARATQNEQIPVGTGVPTLAGAPTQLDGRLDTTLMQAGVTSRATREFTWLASLRYYNSDEKTPQFRVVDNGTGCAATGACVDTTPLQIKTTSGKLEGNYRMPQNWTLVGGLDVSHQERNVPLGNVNAAGVDLQRWVPWRANVDETTLRIEARRSLAETLNGRIALSHSKRDGSEYTATNQAQSDLINPIHIADRDRNKLKLMLDWMAAQSLTLTFNVDYAKDDYKNGDARPYGLIDGTASLFSIDAAYAINEKWSLSAWYTRDQTEATQRGQRNGTGDPAEAVKEAQLEDVGDTLGIGLRGMLAPKLKAGLDLLYSKNVNKYPESITLVGAGNVYRSGTTGPLPNITNTLIRINLNAVYSLQKNAELRFDWIHERWKTDDWSWLFADGTPFTYGTSTDGTQLVQASKQNADFVGVRYIYRFR